MTIQAPTDRGATNERTPGQSTRWARFGKVSVTLTILLVVLVSGILFSASVGQLQADFKDVVGSALQGIGISNAWEPTNQLTTESLKQIRFPRVAMSVLVGAALAVAGVVMQAIFGNPLAEPGVVGVSSGAAVGAAVAFVFGLTWFGGFTVAVLAFLGGFIATVFVYLTARSNGRTEVVTLLLTGIAVNAFGGAALALVIFVGDRASREQIVFWQLGTMNGSRWSEVWVVLIAAIPSVVLALALGKQYDLLSLGERTAVHLGVQVERLRVVSIVLVALLTGVAVAFTGIIAFVGLVIPHLMRMILGPAHRTLIIASCLGGAALLVWSDVAARTLVSGADMPIGMLTALVGGPFFFYLIRRTRNRAGGWA